MPHGAIPYPFGDCRICADKATGVHYGVATCEGCKGFFKRSLPKGDKYKCFFGGQCKLSPQNRNRCKACRFQRCLSMGMSTDAVKMGRIPKVDKERALEQQRREIDTEHISQAIQQNHNQHLITSTAERPPFQPHPAFPSHATLGRDDHHRPPLPPQPYYPHHRVPLPLPGGRFYPDERPYHMNHRHEPVHGPPPHGPPPHGPPPHGPPPHGPPPHGPPTHGPPTHDSEPDEAPPPNLPNRIPHGSMYNSEPPKLTTTELHVERSQEGVSQHMNEPCDNFGRTSSVDKSRDGAGRDLVPNPHSHADVHHRVPELHNSHVPHLNNGESTDPSHHHSTSSSLHPGPPPPNKHTSSHLSPPANQHPCNDRSYSPNRHFVASHPTVHDNSYSNPMLRSPAAHEQSRNYHFTQKLHHDVMLHEQNHTNKRRTMGAVNCGMNGVRLGEGSLPVNSNSGPPPAKIRRMSYQGQEMHNSAGHPLGHGASSVEHPSHRSMSTSYDSGISDSGSDGLVHSPLSMKSMCAAPVIEPEHTASEQPGLPAPKQDNERLGNGGHPAIENSNSTVQEDAYQFKSPSLCSSRPRSHTPSWSSNVSVTSSRPSSRGLYSPGIIKELFHKVMETGSVKNLKMALSRASSNPDTSLSTRSTCLTPHLTSDSTGFKLMSDAGYEDDVKPNIPLEEYVNLAESKAVGLEKFLNDSVERSKACIMSPGPPEVKSEIIDDDDEYGKMTTNGFIDYEEKGMDLTPIVINGSDDLEDATNSLLHQMNSSSLTNASNNSQPPAATPIPDDQSTSGTAKTARDDRESSQFSSSLDEDNIKLVKTTLKRLDKSYQIFNDLLQDQLRMRAELKSGKRKPHRLNTITEPESKDCHEMWQALFETIPGANKVILSICTNIPAFYRLQSEDQALLLKRAYYEVWLIVRSKLFESNDTYLWLANGAYYSQMWMRRFLPLRLIHKYYNFTTEINKCHLSHLELTILCAIRLTHTVDVDGLKNTDQVQLLHNHYLDVLAYVVQQNHKANSGRVLIDIMQTMPLLGAINEEQAKIVGNFTADRPPDLLAANLELERQEQEEEQKRLGLMKNSVDTDIQTQELANLLYSV